ncbi:MAG: hypothetical protein AB1774_06075 [Bacillota bacterium]
MQTLRLFLAMVLCGAVLLAFASPVERAHAQEAPSVQDPSLEIASDIFPPTITVISPAKGEVVTTGTPLIEVAFEDPGSGIDETTMHLAIDKANVTSRATISEDRVTYRPGVPLARGTHEVYFGVRDRAGNLGEVRWSFEVKPFFEGMRVGGRNTLRMEWYPISKATDTLDLTLQARVADSDVRLRLLGRGTNYPGGTPLVSFDDYNLYLDKYSLEVRHGSSAVAAGHTAVLIESEIFQVSREVLGGVASTTLRIPTGQHDLSAFCGKIASSSGLGLRVYDIAGVTEQWKAKTGFVLGAIYASLEGPAGDDGYHVVGARGRLRVAQKGDLRFEVVHGASKDGDASGNGIALHLDVPFASSTLGVDFITLEPDYPLPGAPPSLSPGRGGILRYGLRTMTKVPAKGILTLNGALTRDNLDGSAEYTLNRGNLAVNYYYPVSSALNLRATYQGEYKQSDDLPDPAVDSIASTTSLAASLQLGRAPRRSSVQATYSMGATEDRISGRASSTAKLSGSWSMPLGAWTLSSALDLSRQEASPDGTRTDSTSAKVTASGQVVPKVLQGTFTLFRTGSDKFETASVDPALRKTEAGFETNLRLSVSKSSTLALVFKNSWWTQQDTAFKEGQNRTLNLEWAVSF